MRVRQEADVEDDVGVFGKTMSESETRDADAQRRRPFRSAGRPENMTTQLMDRQAARVHDLIGKTPQRHQQVPLMIDAFRNRRRALDRMRPPGFAETPQDGTVRGFEKNQ